MHHLINCKGCNKSNEEDIFVEMRYDYYGYPTGYYCDDCYENNYPYKKDAYYDYLETGEYLNSDEY